MGLSILDGRTGAAMFCTVTNVAFGPVFCNRSAAESFLAFAKEKWGRRDVRGRDKNELRQLYIDHYNAIQAGDWPCPNEYDEPPDTTNQD